MKSLVKIVAAIVVGILLISCSKVPDSKTIPSYVTISSYEVKGVITNANLAGFKDNIFLHDEDYVIPTLDWVNGEFSKQFKQFLFNYNIRQFQDGKNECDKFSLHARSVANILNRHNPQSGNSGIAVGEVYLINGGGGHAMNFAIVADRDKKLRLVFYEPQAAQIVNVDTNDLAILTWNM